MLRQVLDFFDIDLDYDLDIMKQNQKLSELTANILLGLEPIMSDAKPDLVIVQGDTTTSFVGTLMAYYQRVPVAHVEAGLRSGNLYSPFPEEGNRIIATHLSSFHFAPTTNARENLLREGVSKEKIHVVGNTVIDALFMGLNKTQEMKIESIDPQLSRIDFSKHIILVTGHRRESFGQPFQEICDALNVIAQDNRVEIVYPVHLNPNVREPVFSMLGNKHNVHLIEPVNYPAMVYLMSKSYIILTDSGGVQEEAPSLKKPVLVMRDVTERTEGVDVGVTRIVGTNSQRIVKETFNLLNDSREYDAMATGNNPYGDGLASARIVRILEDIL